MDKGIAVFLSNHGWSHAKIARKFKVSRALVCRVINQIRKISDRSKKGKLLCEICQDEISKKQYVEVAGVEPFLVCNGCKKELLN